MLCLSGAAVKAYMEYTMSTEKGYSSTKGGQRYAGDFKFTSLPTNLLATNNAGIASITLASDVTPFQWEWSTDTTIGPQRNTLSCKRSNYDTYGLSSQGSALAELLDRLPERLCRTVLTGETLLFCSFSLYKP